MLQGLAFTATALLVLLSLGCESLFTRTPTQKRVLFVGIDGVRTDSLRKAHSPVIDQLAAEGIFTDRMNILAPRDVGHDTVSHSSWSTIFTGVWADKHGVRTSDFSQSNFDRYPHVFQLVKQRQPTAITAVIMPASNLAKNIPAKADVARFEPLLPGSSHDARQLARDVRIGRLAERVLLEDDPTATFVYFYGADWIGHQDGFHPTVRRYVQAIEEVDKSIGLLIHAIKSRPSYRQEDWLVIVATDHGGINKDHAGEQDSPEVTEVWAVFSGRSVSRSASKDVPFLVDIPRTILAHLQIGPDPDWELDGRVFAISPE